MMFSKTFWVPTLALFTSLAANTVLAQQFTTLSTTVKQRYTQQSLSLDELMPNIGSKQGATVHSVTLNILNGQGPVSLFVNNQQMASVKNPLRQTTLSLPGNYVVGGNLHSLKVATKGWMDLTSVTVTFRHTSSYPRHGYPSYPTRPSYPQYPQYPDSSQYTNSIVIQTQVRLYPGQSTEVLNKFNTWEYFGKKIKKIEVRARSNKPYQQPALLKLAINHVPLQSKWVGSQNSKYTFQLIHTHTIDPNVLNSIELYTADGDITITGLILYVK